MREEEVYVTFKYRLCYGNRSTRSLALDRALNGCTTAYGTCDSGPYGVTRMGCDSYEDDKGRHLPDGSSEK